MSTAPITIDSAIAVPGEIVRYAFKLESNIKLVFDSLTNNAAFHWKLVGPTGTVVPRRSFNASDSVGLRSNPVLELPPGEYMLTVDADKDSTGSYSFRLLDVSTATAVTSGMAITGQLGPANETDVRDRNP